jgi:hypothetical protein
VLERNIFVLYNTFLCSRVSFVCSLNCPCTKCTLLLIIAHDKSHKDTNLLAKIQLPDELSPLTYQRRKSILRSAYNIDIHRNKHHAPPPPWQAHARDNENRPFLLWPSQGWPMYYWTHHNAANNTPSISINQIQCSNAGLCMQIHTHGMHTCACALEHTPNEYKRARHRMLS